MTTKYISEIKVKHIKKILNIFQKLDFGCSGNLDLIIFAIVL